MPTIQTWDIDFIRDRRRPRTILPVGDSITQFSTGGTVDYYNYTSGYAETSIRLAGGFDQIGNAGVAGNTTTQILARFQTDVLALMPDVILLMAGTNDFASGMTSAAIATCMNNLETMIVQSLRLGIQVVLVTPPPKNAAPLDAQNMMRFYYELAAYYRLPLVDIYQLLVDPTNGNYKSGMSGDGTHPNDAAIAIMAAAVKTCLLTLDSWRNRAFMASVSATGLNSAWNLLRNGSFAQQASPPAPDGWTLNNTGATQTAPDAAAPYVGKEFTHTKTSAGGVFAFSGANATLVPGNKIRFSGSLEISGRSGATGGHAQINYGSSKQLRALGTWLQDGSFDFCVDQIVPPGIVAGNGQLYVQDIGTYKARQWTLIDITAQEAIWKPGVLAVA